MVQDTRQKANRHQVREVLDQTPPSDLPAERAVIGSMLLDGSTCGPVAQVLRAADFHDPANVILFGQILDMHKDGQPIDLKLVHHRLKNTRGRTGTLLDDIGGEPTISRILSEGAATANATHYANIVRERAIQRRARSFAEDIIATASNGVSCADLITMMASGVADLSADTPIAPPQITTIGDMIGEYPRLRQPVIDGIIREAETANIIADPKRGKSWLTYGLALSVVTGQRWLGEFAVYPGRVLLIDNELHPETIPYRVKTVAEAMTIPQADYADRLHVVSLRGRLMDMFALGSIVGDIEADAYQAVIVDAFYRMYPTGISENDNAQMANIYNLIDQYAGKTSAAWVLIHHATKGSQTGKAVTDVGAGAGSQSRAADCHLVLRAHQEPDHVVLDAAVRSFPPIRPVVLQWDFPLWTSRNDMDATKLKGKLTPGQERQAENDAEGFREIEKALADGPDTARAIRGRTGMGKGRADRLLGLMVRDGKLICRPILVRGNESHEYAVTEPE